MTLCGHETYRCSARRNRGDSVCSSRVGVNGPEAERRVLQALESLIYREDLLAEVVERAQERWRREQLSRRVAGDRGTELRRQLAEVNAEIGRLVDAIAAGALVGELQVRMREAESRRQALETEMQTAANRAREPSIAVLPAAVVRIIGNLGAALERGRVAEVRSVLLKVVERIGVTEVAVPGRKRPVPRLTIQGSLTGALQLATQNSKRGSSGGGICREKEDRLPALDRRDRLQDASQARGDGLEDAATDHGQGQGGHDNPRGRGFIAG